MRIFVMLVQLIWLGMLSLVYAEYGIKNEPEQQLFAVIGFLGPLAAILYIGFHPVNAKDSYLGLIFERRRLEEQAKINKLKSETK